MTTTFQTTDSIGTGIRFMLAGSFDRYTVVEGVKVISTDSDGITSLYAQTAITIDGSVRADGAAIYLGVTATGSNILVGTNGILSSSSAVTNATVFLNAWTASLVNYGQITSASAIGTLSGGSNVTIQNFGVISGASGASIGLSGAVGNTLTNGGTISASSYDDSMRDTRYNNAVFSEGANTQIVNLAGGVLSAISSAGNGVRLGAESGNNNMDGSSVINHGQIVSAQSDGVRFAGQADDTLTLINHGTITGAGWAFRGDVQTDLVTNRGMMRGSVDLGDGADTFDGRGGTVTGTVYGGTGDDTYVVSDSTIALEELFDDGIDLVASEVDWVLGENFENLYLLGIADTRGYGNALNNAITGNTGDNRLLGGGGSDMLRGGDGDDILHGGLGWDKLYGDDGDDTLIGGPGRDILTGGDGDDLFQFRRIDHSPAGTNGDVIRDFDRGADLIDLSLLVPGEIAFLGGTGFTGTGLAELRISVAGASSVVRIDVNGDGGADMAITVKGLTGLDATDFLL
jgi:Ca2+-binding RTX toxin-like protein